MNNKINLCILKVLKYYFLLCFIFGIGASFIIESPFYMKILFLLMCLILIKFINKLISIIAKRGNINE
jgi:hypothetical protein